MVSALLAPFALYPGWVWALRRGGRGLELGVFVAGLHFGVGMISIIEVVVFPADTTYGITDALPGFLFSRSVFVLPATLLAAAARGPRHPLRWSGGPRAACAIACGHHRRCAVPADRDRRKPAVRGRSDLAAAEMTKKPKTSQALLADQSTNRGRSLRISPNNRKADPCGSASALRRLC